MIPVASSEGLARKTALSLVWKFSERFGVQFVQFVVSIVIARILDPDEYGQVALLTIFISLATVFVQSGLSTALVQKKDADETDCSSVFFYSLAMAAALYATLFFLAIPIADFYGMPGLVPLLRVLSLTLFPGALNSLQNAILARRMLFRIQFRSSMVAVVTSGGAGIAAALVGWGAWALVAQQLLYQVAICVVLMILLKWRPTLSFSFDRTKVLLSYGVKLLGANLVDTLYHNLESLIIGKKYFSEALAFCNKGKMFPLTLVDNIDGSIQSVMLPVYSSKQDSPAELKAMLRRTTALSTYLVFPFMVGLAAVAEPIVGLLLGDKWLGCVPYLQIYCAAAMLFPLQTNNAQAFNAMGRSDVYLKTMVVKRLIGLVVLAVATFAFDDPLAIIVACVVVEAVGVAANFPPNRSLFGYTVGEQAKDVLPNLFISALMGCCVYPCLWLGLGDLPTLLLQVLVGVAAYALLSAFFRNPSWGYLIEKLRPVERAKTFFGRKDLGR